MRRNLSRRRRIHPHPSPAVKGTSNESGGPARDPPRMFLLEFRKARDRGAVCSTRNLWKCSDPTCRQCDLLTAAKTELRPLTLRLSLQSIAFYLIYSATQPPSTDRVVPVVVSALSEQR